MRPHARQGELPEADASNAEMLSEDNDGEGVLGHKGSDDSSKAGLKGRSLYLFEGTNRLRHMATNLVGHNYFSNFILFTIFVSAVQLALDSPL